MTVLGPVAVGELGHVQVHEHLLLDSNRAPFVGDLDKLLNHRDLAVAELAHYEQAGGGTLVEVTTPDLGRDAPGLRQIALESGVHIVMGCGFYREPYYPEWIDSVSTGELARYLVDEIAFGVDETGIRPGVIGEIGSHRSWVSAREERVFRAAGRAQRVTGLGLMTHTPPGAAAQHLALLGEEGADLRRIAVGHADTWLDLDYHRQILEQGCFVSFDHIGMRIYPDDWRARHLVALLHEGYTSQILLSTDIYSRSRLKAWGGDGYPCLIETFLPRLRELAVSDDMIHEITIVNPARFLTGDGSSGAVAAGTSERHVTLADLAQMSYGLFRPLRDDFNVPRFPTE
jgi:predicted metal-dependent phosphotriesterase family hydrolase